MTSLLYYSISSDLTEDEIIEIDKQVAVNREKVYLFLKELPSNSKRKAKRFCLSIVFIFTISQPLVPYAVAVVMPLPPAIHRLSPIEESIIRTQKNYPQIATIPESKVDKIRLTNEQIKQFNNLALQLNSGSMQVTEDFKITDWQAASHLYHGKGVDVNPEDFGITQAELIKIQDEGFIKYVQRGNKLPSIEHVRTYQKSLKNICLDPSTDRRDDSEYYNPHGVTPTTAFKNDRYLVCFNQTTGNLITGDKQRRGTINKFDQTNKIGSQKWINKWSK